jgi:hypothetical protein
MNTRAFVIPNGVRALRNPSWYFDFEINEFRDRVSVRAKFTTGSAT